MNMYCSLAYTITVTGVCQKKRGCLQSAWQMTVAYKEESVVKVTKGDYVKFAEMVMQRKVVSIVRVCIFIICLIK